MAPIAVIPPKSTARRTSAVKIVPNAPNCKVDNSLQMQPLSFLFSFVKAATSNVTTSSPTAIAKPIHKKSGKTAIVPVMLRISVTIPATRLAAIPNAVQPILQLQKPIISPPLIVYAQANIMLLHRFMLCGRMLLRWFPRFVDLFYEL